MARSKKNSTPPAPPCDDMADQHISLSDIAGHFKDLKDPRCPINIVHPLENVLVMAVLGILAGANGPTAIAEWAWAQRAWLGQHLTLPEAGTPSKDVFLHVLSLLKPSQFQACFTHWLESLKLKAMQKHKVDRPILSIDGKTLRRSHDKANNLKALHCVSVWASELGLTLGQVPCHEKSNEITAIPEVLQLVDIEGTIITIDAMGCQKSIAKQIVEGKADYLLALKANQESLHNEVIEYVHEQLANDFAGCQAQQLCVTEKLHGQEETRIYTHLPVPKELSMLEDWEGMKSIGVAVRCYKVDGEETSDVRYYISSLEVDVEQFARGARQHWGIENGCHWTLDMTFREDYSRIRGEKIRENFAFLNRMALSLLKQHPGKQSIAMKRQLCGWNPDFLLEVLTGHTT